VSSSDAHRINQGKSKKINPSHKSVPPIVHDRICLCSPCGLHFFIFYTSFLI